MKVTESIEPAVAIQHATRRLMAAYGIDARQATELLAWRTHAVNRPLSAFALTLIQEIPAR